MERGITRKRPEVGLWTAIGALSLAAALATGCASNARVPEADRPEASSPPAAEARGPNPGAEVAKGCAGGAIGVLKLGLLGVPLSAGILVMCMPLAAATAVIHEVMPPGMRFNDGTGAPNFAYPSGSDSGGGYVNGGRGSSNFVYPNSYWGYYGR